MEYLKNFVIFAIKKVLEKALQLYFILKEKDVPLNIKAIIAIALIYVIFPVDIIPDFIPILGWIDDFIVLIVVLKTVPQYITDDIRKKAVSKLEGWFS